MMRSLFVTLALLVPSVQAAAPPSRGDSFGDPLPPGARARLGTPRLQGLADLSADGKVIALVRHGRVLLHDSGSARVLHSFEPDISVSEPRFLRGGQLLLRGQPYSPVLFQVWEPGTGRLVDKVLAKDVGIPAAARASLPDIDVSADGRRFVVRFSKPGGAPTVTVWQRAPLNLLRQVRVAHTQGNWVLLSGDGSTLVTGGQGPGKDDPLDKVLQVWDLRTGREKRLAVHDAGSAFKYAVSPDGKLVAGARDKDVGLYQTADEKLLHALPVKLDYRERLTFRGDGKQLLVLGTRLRIYDPASGRRLGVYAWPFRPGDVGDAVKTLRIVLPPGGKTLALAQRAETAEVWELETGRAVTPATGHDEPVSALAFSADGKVLYSGDRGAHLLRWDLATGKALPRFPVSLSNPTNLFGSWPTVTFSPDAQRVFLSEVAMRLRLGIFDRASGRLQGQLRRPGSIRSDWCVPAFSQGGKWFVLQCVDTRHKAADPGTFRLQVTDAETGKVALPVEIKGVYGVTAALSPDGSRLVTGALHRPEKGPRTIELTSWDVKTGKSLARTKLRGVEGFLAVAPDGRSVLVYTSINPGRLVVWDLLTGKTRKAVTGAWVYAPFGPLFSPDGRTVAFATCADAWKKPTVRVYEWATLTERFAFRDPSSAIFVSLAYCPDGGTLASGDGNGTILLWDLAGASKKQHRTLAQLWEDLAVPNAAEAWPVMRELVGRPAEAARLLGERLSPPSPPPNTNRLAALLKQLDADSAAERERASAALAPLARAVEPQLRQARQASTSAEVRKRLDRLLDGLDWLTPDEVRTIRAVEVLERIGSAEARGLLHKWAAGPREAVLVREAKQALRRLGSG